MGTIGITASAAAQDPTRRGTWVGKMKQTQFAFHDEETLRAELNKIRRWCQNELYASVLLHLLTRSIDEEAVTRMLGIIRQLLPDALVVGCSSNGNIVKGDYSDEAAAVNCFLFEYPTTKVEVLQYPLSADSQEEMMRGFHAAIRERAWVKGIEMLATIRGMSMTTLCEGLSDLDESIQIFGGGALSEDVESNDACVFSHVGGYQSRSIVFVLYGGDELHLDTRYVTGWKPLGSSFTVTGADGYTLKEVNHLPAYEIYRRYLHIQNDEHFFANTREFPLFYHLNGIDILRAPIASNPDGSITMTSDVSVGIRARLAYGDPQTILESSWQEGNRLLSFAPECILVFSCAGRRTFWGNSEIGKETEPFQMAAPTFGFYTSGEFLRTGRYLNQHNVTQVIAALREGEAKAPKEQSIPDSAHSQEGKVSMIRRLATFIKVTTEELEEANRQLQEANRKLSELAVIDALTNVGNKNAYFEKVKQIEADGSAQFAVAVFDLNGLKSINDSRGHEIGDLAIIKAADDLKAVFKPENIFRIGGDEFIALLTGKDEADMRELFCRLDRVIEEQNERDPDIPIGISKGFSVYAAGRDAAYQEVVRRADEAMYADKAEYYRRHDRRRR